MNDYIIDTHCHLDFDALTQNLADVLKRAEEAKIGKLITIGVKIKNFANQLNLVNTYSNIYGSIGTHPNSAHEEQDISLDYLIQQTLHKKIVAIGETGLDYFYETAPKGIQKNCFVKHIQAAQATALPLVIHTRKADIDTMEILQEHSNIKKFPFVLHCYSSSLELAKLAIDLGGYISFSGIATFKNGQAVRDIAASIPLNRLLIETDAPYLAPVPYRGKVNEPSYIVETAKILANYLGIDYDEFIKATTNNALRLFTKLA